MKIVYKIHVTNLFAIVLIVLVAFFSYQNLNLVLTKLRFIEIADDLNASFLEMRLNEKNYFLYNDKTALVELRKKLADSLNVMDSVKEDIIRATGENNFAKLKSSLNEYWQILNTIDINQPVNSGMQSNIREAGQKLREFSSHITSLERQKTNKIIAGSKKGLFTSLCFILLSAITVSYLFFFNILKSLKKIKKVARSISDARYYEVEKDIPRDEIGSVLKAINFMSKELQNREEQIIQSKKLASIGILTAGVAHELGNPLNNISMIAQTYIDLYDKLNEEDRVGFMKMVEEEAERIKDIVQNLLDFSKPKKENLKTTDINSVLHKSLKLVQNMIHISNIGIQMNLQDGLPPLFIDENRILEVIVNLITNSIHATPPGGKLTLETRLKEKEGNVEILVIDTGKGIPAEVLPNLFDPFFSTKGTSGTGLGLFVSYGIIKNHGGSINVDSQVGVGTTFTIRLPINNQIVQGEKIG
jgi:two-component system, NtrC family, sensor kinase